MPIQYNTTQLQAIYSNEPKIVVRAPAGSGKTASLCGAIQEYIALHPTHSVTAITFTRKAAEELSIRVNNSRVKTGTIHSWSLHQLYALGRKYNFAVELLEEEEMRRIMQNIAKKRRLNFININQLYHYIVGNIKTIDIEESLVKRYEQIKADYINYKETMGLYDFTDLPQYLLNMLNEYEEEIYDIDAFFVDECQDIDEIQFQIFDKVMARKKFYIGDDRQAIYAFNGALEDAFERYSADGYKFFELNVNYRSKQSIMDVADSFREFCDGGYITEVQTIKTSDITCDRGKGGCVYFINKNGECTTTSNAPTENPKEVLEMLLSKPDTMILCRSNKQVRKLQAFGITNCSTVHQAKGLEYQNVILTDILAETNEELNIAYVGMTRAKDELCVINFEYLIGLLPRINYTPAPKDTSAVLF